MVNPRGHFVWYELMTIDADAAAEFYGAVVGWKIRSASGSDAASDAGERDYRMLVRDDGGNAGGMLELTSAMLSGGARPTWIPYLYAADVDATVAAITQDGGQLLMPIMDLPVGRIAMVTDPQGVPLYVMDPIPPEGDPDHLSDVFSPEALQRVSWNELASPDQNAAKAFYGKHFGFEVNESMSMGDIADYCFIDQQGARLGAIMQQQDEQQLSGWLMYFRVPSIEVAKAAVETKGGRIMVGPQAVPGGDWIVIAADPQGVQFGLVAAAPA